MTHPTSTATLGRRTVSRIGFGAMQLAGPGVFGPPTDPDACRAVLRRAVELGVNLIDTSQSYGPDVVNALIAEALRPYPDDLLIATKVGGTRDADGGWVRASRPDQIRDLVEDDLRTLGVDRIGLVNLRRRVGGPDPDPIPIVEQVGVLTDLQAEGKVDLIGVSNVTADEIRLAVEAAPVAAVQNAFNIADRTDEPVLELCRELAIAYVPYYPLGSAFTGGPPALASDPAIAAVAAAHDATPTQVALAWLLGRYERLLLIPGTRSLAHLEDNLAAGSLRLTDDDLAVLEHVAHLGGPGF
jgi:aryl-alcohol dehydrogenase-like predicted oxidoreductase